MREIVFTNEPNPRLVSVLDQKTILDLKCVRLNETPIDDFDFKTPFLPLKKKLKDTL